MADNVGSHMEGLFQSIANKDWKGVLGSVLDMFGGMGGNVGKWAKIGSSILGALPGFKTGGSFTVGRRTMPISTVAASATGTQTRRDIQSARGIGAGGCSGGSTSSVRNSA